MNMYGGVEVRLHAFLTLALVGGEWSASHPGRFIPWKEPRYTLDRRLGGPQSRSGRGGKEKNSQVLQGLEPDHAARSLVAIPTELSRLISIVKLKVKPSVCFTKSHAMMTHGSEET
jgi:hypothetical protein